MEYRGRQTAQISFPLGGIGTGCIGLGGNGGLVDVEIKNQPNKNSTAEFTHFAIKAEQDGKVLDARVLQGDLERDYIGCTERPVYTGYGFGPDRGTMAGFPHFKDVVFKGEYPFAELDFSHEKFPGKVHMTAFNPLIPTKEDDSSIPAAFFEFRIFNPAQEKITYTLALSCNNYYSRTDTCHTFERNGDLSLIYLSNTGDRDVPGYGDLTIATDSEKVSCQQYWFRGRWFDNSSVFWQEFTHPGRLVNRVYEADRQNPDSNETSDAAVLAAEVEVEGQKEARIRFLLSWSCPYINNSWEITHLGLSEEEIRQRRSRKWKNYYSVLFEDSRASAVYGLKNFDRLYRETMLYKEAVFSSTLPEAVKDAVTANISILKSPTCLRLEDGSFYAFEGVHAHMGSCEGTCTHVWSYAYALAFLFPRLERSARTNEYTYSMQEDGGMGFRIQLPLGVGPTNHRPAADGQFGTVLRVYREFLISGDIKWLEGIWPEIKRSIEFAWSPRNQDCWDADKDGILEGRQHHTLDMELFGANSWLSGMYLAALLAACSLAEVLGDDQAGREYRKVYNTGKRQLNERLYNGEYFFQDVDLKDRSLLEKYNSGFSMHGANAAASYWNEENQEMKYQIGEGCSIDQVLGQWHADMLNLGDVFEPEKVYSALKSIYRYNFIPDMREHVNPCRIYGFNGESGTMICSYPEGRRKPFIPVPYAEETMHGFEYQAASHMIKRGLEKEGLACVEAVRSRYDGYKRNPWNEMECGSNYARSLASYVLLLAYSGFIYDVYHKKIGFKPLVKGDYCFFWSLDTGFGTVERAGDNITLRVSYGKLTVQELVFESAFTEKIQRIQVEGDSVEEGQIEDSPMEGGSMEGSQAEDSPTEDGRVKSVQVGYQVQGENISLSQAVVLSAGESLKLCAHRKACCRAQSEQ